MCVSHTTGDLLYHIRIQLSLSFCVLNDQTHRGNIIRLSVLLNRQYSCSADHPTALCERRPRPHLVRSLALARARDVAPRTRTASSVSLSRSRLSSCRSLKPSHISLHSRGCRGPRRDGGTRTSLAILTHKQVPHPHARTAPRRPLRGRRSVVQWFRMPARAAAWPVQDRRARVGGGHPSLGRARRARSSTQHNAHAGGRTRARPPLRCPLPQ